MKRSVLLFAFVFFLFATTVVAQRTTTDNNDATTTADSTDADETDTAAQTTNTDEATTTADSDATTATEDATTTTDDATTTTDDSETTTTEDSTSEPTSTTAESTATSTDDATTTTEATTSAPITTGSTSVATVPTLAGQYSYPAASVPPTDNAPFMKPNRVPEGTFFIAVGAVLGAFGAAILLWRAVVAWQLHRSVKRAALAQQMSNDKLSYAAPAAPFYKYADRESSPSLANASTGRGVRRTQRGPIPSSTPSQTNLFFSPTAPGANSASNRESRFLPSGFYAAGAAAQPQSHTHSISLTNLRPDSRGHARAVGPSPPDSPSLAPREPARRNMSSSTLNLNRPTSGRAPSAYLDDLLADQPEQFPPQHHPTPNRNSSWSQSPQNRN